MPSIAYVCNVCAASNRIEEEQLSRETGLCCRCGANVRLRAMIHLLSLHLWGKSIPISEWPRKREIVGFGVSDWPEFTTYLAKKLDYRNTQFDEAFKGERPFLDITAPPSQWLGTADFIMCSEVLEHVAPPVQRAFDGLYSLLKPAGALIFSVPYWFEPTLEHFPDLHDWKLEERGGVRTLVNTTASGESQTFTDLCFHGGGTAVLEMRIFGYDDLVRQLQDAGFDGVETVQEEYLPYGIRLGASWSLPIIARKATT